MASASIHILFFGPLKDIVGSDRLTVDIAEAPTGAAAFEAIAARYPELHEWKGCVRLAVNCAYTDFDQSLGSGDEVSFLPPVSGG
jgi:molybdopterin converting factor subunit 1